MRRRRNDAADASAEGGADARNGRRVHVTSSGPDSGSVGGPVACGATYCTPGQTCNAGACEYAGCKGVTVPGDYPSLADAAAVVRNQGGGTICVGDYVHEEQEISVYGALVSGGPLPITIQGISPARSRVGKLVLEGTVTLRGMSAIRGAELIPIGAVVVEGSSFGSTVLVNAPSGASGSVTVRASTVHANGSDSAVWVRPTTWPIDVVLDGLEGSAPSGYWLRTTNVGITDGLTPPPGQNRISLQNSFVHDSVVGAYLEARGVEMRVVNNTFTGNGIALYGGRIGTTGFRANNIYVGQTNVAVSSPLAGHNELLFGNAGNYGPDSADGANVLKVDPLLDMTQTPPALRPGSPARAAGDASVAPALDFFGTSRATRADLGARQQ